MPTIKTKAASTLTGTQYRVLKALAASKTGLTRSQLATDVFGGNSVNFRPILEPLAEAKLITSKEKVTLGMDNEPDGAPKTVFSATALGKKEVTKAPPARAGGNGKAEHQPLPKVGQSFTKTYLGKDYTVKVVDGGFQVGKETYTSLTAAAKGIRGSSQEVNGWAFFGLVKAEAKEPNPAKAPKAAKPAKAKATA